MKKLTIIITMAGLGSRFKEAGYNIPKYKIIANKKTLFEWSLDSLLGFKDNVKKIIFIVRKDDNAPSFILDKSRHYHYGDIEIIEINKPTDGQATTAMLAISHCDNSSPILIYNIDTYIEPYELKYEFLKGDGHIPCFHSEGNHWSFVKLNEKNQVIDVREKERISNNCSLGAYYFSSAALYMKLYKEYYENGTKKENTEKYIAPLYNHMLKMGLTVTISTVDKEKVHVLGTPEELALFINGNYK